MDERSCEGCGAIFTSKPYEKRPRKRTRFCSRSCILKKCWRNRQRKPILDRFVDKILIGNDCWLWLGGKDKDGYPRTRDNKKPYRQVRASRMAYELFIGPFPPGTEACHKCDNPPCVRPSHIFPGTHSDNMRDAIQKGRKVGMRGEAHPLAKLTNDEVLEIKILIRSKVRSYSIAKRFGVSAQTISNIKKERQWAHIK